jgi:hypothetical protein
MLYCEINFFLSFCISSSLFVCFGLFILSMYVLMIMSCMVTGECILEFRVILPSNSRVFLLIDLIGLLGIPAIG